MDQPVRVTDVAARFKKKERKKRNCIPLKNFNADVWIPNTFYCWGKRHSSKAPLSR